MKRYATTYSNGHTAETSQAHEAGNYVNHDDDQVFFLSGQPVPAVDFFAAVNQANDAAFEKKNQTHKKIRVLHGSSAGNYVAKWIKR